MQDRTAPARLWSFTGDDMDRGPFGYMGHYEELRELVECIRSWPRQRNHDDPRCRPCARRGKGYSGQ